MYYQMPDSCQIKTLDAIYEKAFGHKKDGFFLDIGAFDGITFSNAWGLAKAGWSGIMFEPDHDSFIRCQDRYANNKNVEVVESAIGRHNEPIRFWANGALSTTSQRMAAEGRLDDPNGKYPESPTLVQCHCMNYYLANLLPTQFKSKGRLVPDIDVVSIDVECAELDVLDGFDIGFWAPTMVIIEAHELNILPQLSRNAKAINDYFSHIGYAKIYCDDINNIYVSADPMGGTYDGKKKS